jgi:hypothetical protein
MSTVPACAAVRRVSRGERQAAEVQHVYVLRRVFGETAGIIVIGVTWADGHWTR